jgi:hypothetical protein
MALDNLQLFDAQQIPAAFNQKDQEQTKLMLAT